MPVKKSNSALSCGSTESLNVAYFVDVFPKFIPSKPSSNSISIICGTWLIGVSFENFTTSGTFLPSLKFSIMYCSLCWVSLSCLCVFGQLSFSSITSTPICLYSCIPLTRASNASVPFRSGDFITLCTIGQPQTLLIPLYLCETVSCPSFGSPSQFNAACERGNGVNGVLIPFFSFPGLGFEVVVPPMYPPAPMLATKSYPSPFLNIPAAFIIGALNGIPHSFLSRFLGGTYGSSCLSPTNLFRKFTLPFEYNCTTV